MSDIFKIKITVDKSHLFTLGEKMYRESIEFVRELVNNAYDADATTVRIMIENDSIAVADDGAGMDAAGLEQFFRIGSAEKRIRGISPRFGRRRVGQFGIGKFSALSLANQFIVESVKGKFKYSVIFDRGEWQSSENWDLPIEKEPVSPFDKEGTKIILKKLIKKINVSEVEKYLMQSVPLRAKRFSIFLNNKRIAAKTVPGKIIPISIKTLYGPIEGEIVIALNQNDVDEPGVECRVKQVFIKREMFGIEKLHYPGVSKITGSANADFLPVLSSRSDFIVDSPEYKLFYQLMRAEMDNVLKEIKKHTDTKNLQKITKELQEIMRQVKEALLLNPDFVPKGRAVARLRRARRGEIAAGANFRAVNPEPTSEDALKTKAPNSENKKEENESPERIAGEIKPIALKRIRLQKLGISCGIVSLGEAGPEVISQGNAVYINHDHPLYKRMYERSDLLGLHLLRLLTQEIILMKKLHIGAKEAFEWQGKLLKDAMC